MIAVSDQPRGIAAIYVRISEDRAGAGLGTARQDADCRPICLRRGYPPERIRLYEDNDTSAYSGKRRVQYEHLLADIASGEVTLVAAWHPDRLHRSPIELEEFIAVVERAGIEVETARAGALDLDPSGRMVARQLGVVARYESEHKSDRQRRKHQQLADEGKLAGGGTRPYGYKDDRRSLHPVEAQYLREAARRVLEGELIRAVCRDFTARGVGTVTGGLWAPTVLRNLLTSARISGRREHGRRHGRGGATVLAPITCVDAQWEAVISATDSDALRAQLTSPGRRKNGGLTAHSYLLRGLARCGRCGKGLVARPRADRRRCYVCASGPGFNGCGGIRILAEELEADVAARLLVAVDEGELETILAASDGADVAAARDASLAAKSG